MEVDIALLFSGRGDDIQLVKHFLSEGSWEASHLLNFKVTAFQSKGSQDFKSKLLIEIHSRRIEADDLSQVDKLSEREIYLCGPDALTNNVQAWLGNLNVPSENVHLENFYF